MPGCAKAVIVAALSLLLVISHCYAIAIQSQTSQSRARRDASWDLFSSYFAHQECFARPCLSDADCCDGYACTGLRAINRRAMPLRSCALSMEGLENLL